MARSQPIPLHQLKVLAPCHESWLAMEGDETEKHCLQCEKSVYNLSRLTKREAKTLVDALDGNLCVRYETDPEGRMRHVSGILERLHRKLESSRRFPKLAAALGAVLVATTASGGCGGEMGKPAWHKRVDQSKPEQDIAAKTAAMQSEPASKNEACDPVELEENKESATQLEETSPAGDGPSA